MIESPLASALAPIAAYEIAQRLLARLERVRQRRPRSCTLSDHTQMRPQQRRIWARPQRPNQNPKHKQGLEPMKISDLKNSKFLTKEDCEPPITVTIAGAKRQNVAPADQKPDEKWCLVFAEPDVKPMVLNPTNGTLIAKFLGSDHSDDWTGKKIVLFHDESVTYAGKLVGGIRVRKYDAELTEDVPW